MDLVLATGKLVVRFLIDSAGHRSDTLSSSKTAASRVSIWVPPCTSRIKTEHCRLLFRKAADNAQIRV